MWQHLSPKLLIFLAVVAEGSAMIVAAVLGLTLAAANTSINLPGWAVLGIVVSAIGTPLVNAWMRRIDKRSDWKRQDEVAKRVEEAKVAVSEAATSLIESNAIVASAQAENEKDQKQIRKSLHSVLGEVQAAATTRVNLGEQLEEIKMRGKAIHSLVNGQLTASMQSDLDGKTIQLMQMKELIHLRGGEPSDETVAALEILKQKIKELSHALEERREKEAKEHATN